MQKTGKKGKEKAGYNRGRNDVNIIVAKEKNIMKINREGRVCGMWIFTTPGGDEAEHMTLFTHDA